MKKLASIALMATATTMALAPTVVSAAENTTAVHAATEEAAPAVDVNAGKMLYGANGRRIASIYRVTEEGDPQIILNGRMVTVPASTLSDVDGKVTTSLTKREISRSR
ncbi:MAG: hypothetical protein H6917_10705 [Novosphingobium sp.]|nr:hypothetical protein [Novosphingobium sp.]MCP5402842.1 hypothetical protein [Novosphingobium sp.]